MSGNLDFLLEWDGSLEEEATITFPRGEFELKVACKTISSEVYRQIEKSCMQYSKLEGETIDNHQFLRKMIFQSVVDPDLRNAELQAKFKPAMPYLIVNQIFKSGELIQLMKLINRLSGFKDDVESDNEIENLLREQRSE